LLAALALVRCDAPCVCAMQRTVRASCADAATPRAAAQAAGY
jgi:hypothetical protein